MLRTIATKITGLRYGIASAAAIRSADFAGSLRGSLAPPARLASVGSRASAVGTRAVAFVGTPTLS